MINYKKKYLQYKKKYIELKKFNNLILSGGTIDNLEHEINKIDTKIQKIIDDTANDPTAGTTIVHTIPRDFPINQIFVYGNITTKKCFDMYLGPGRGVGWPRTVSLIHSKRHLKNKLKELIVQRNEIVKQRNILIQLNLNEINELKEQKLEELNNQNTKIYVCPNIIDGEVEEINLPLKYHLLEK